MSIKSRNFFNRATEYLLLILIVLELSQYLTAVVSRFKYRLPPQEGATFGHDGRLAFDFAADVSGIGFMLVLLLTLPCLIASILSLTVWRSENKGQTTRIVGLLVTAALFWFPAFIAIVAYSF